MSKTSISTTEELHKGDYLLSNNSKYKAVFQEDGNFVVYNDILKWQSDTANMAAFKVLLQNDQNLVMYAKDGRPIWASNTGAPTNSQTMRLTMTDQGHLVLDNNGVTVWTSEKSVGKKQ